MSFREIEIERFRAPSPKLDSKQNRMEPQAGMFLKGPIPLEWLMRAANLPGKALHVGNVLWLLAGLNQSRTVQLSSMWLRRFGVLRDSARLGLKKLEGAGLVAVERHHGRSPKVTILDPRKIEVENL